MFSDKPLIIFEMANNHMGDLDHGLLMVDTFGQFVGDYPFDFAFKLQFRNIPTFIHPDYQARTDIKYVKRFGETALSKDQFAALIERIRSKGMLALTTPFDEPSVGLATELGVDGLKIGSCSFTDWPLLETVAGTDKPVIASTAGASLEEIDGVVSFLQHRGKDFAIMHCVGEYPTAVDDLQLNQISLLKSRYPEVRIGFSTHEDPANSEAVYVAFGKGACIFEKHVAVETDEYPRNAYSANPEEIRAWLDSAYAARRMLGVDNERHPVSSKEQADLRQFKRGMFAKADLNAGHVLRPEDVFFAFPNQDGQLLANDLSKYRNFTLQKDLVRNVPVMEEDVEGGDARSKVYEIVQDIKAFLNKAEVVYPGGAELEISHHYGIDKFYETGIAMLTVVNRAYCKKLIAVLPWQQHPEQFHKKKEETFHVLHGDVQLCLDDELTEMGPGKTITIKPGVRHRFTSRGGCIIEEISSTHLSDDSFYTDEAIMRNTNRKTLVKYWPD